MDTGDVVNAQRLVGEKRVGLEELAVADIIEISDSRDKKQFVVFKYERLARDENQRFLELLRCDIIPSRDKVKKIIKYETYTASSDQVTSGEIIFDREVTYSEGSTDFEKYERILQNLKTMNRKRTSGDPWVD